MPSIPEPLRNEIVRLRLQEGYGRNQIQKIASGKRQTLTRDTVSKVLNHFYEECGKNGIEKSAKVYNLSEVLDELIAIAKARRENGLQAPEMILGAKIGKMANGMKMDLSLLENFTREVFRRHEEENLDVNGLTNQCKVINDLEATLGKPFSKLKEEFDELGNNLPIMREEISERSNELDGMKKQKIMLLKKNLITEKELEEISELRRDLKTIDLNLNDFKSSAKVLLNMKKQRQNPQKIVSKLKQFDDLNKSLADLNSKIKDRKSERSTLEDQNAKLEKELGKRKGLFSEVRKLEEAKLSVPQVQKLRNIVVTIGSQHGKDPRKAFEEFENDVLKNYDAILGLIPVVTSLEGKREILENENREEELKSKRLHDAYSKQEREIKAYNALSAINITGESILKWERIISNGKLNPVVVERELRTSGTLAKTQAKMNAAIEELQSKEKLLFAKTRELETKKKEIEASINTISENGTNKLATLSEDARTKISGLLAKAETGITNLENEGKNAISRLTDFSEKKATELKASLSSTVEGIKGSLTDKPDSLRLEVEGFIAKLKLALEDTTPQIETISNTLEAGRKIGEFSGAIALIDLLNGKDVPNEKLVPLLHLVTKNSKALLSAHPLKNNVTETLSKLEIELHQEATSSA